MLSKLVGGWQSSCVKVAKTLLHFATVLMRSAGLQRGCCVLMHVAVRCEVVKRTAARCWALLVLSYGLLAKDYLLCNKRVG